MFAIVEVPVFVNDPAFVIVFAPEPVNVPSPVIFNAPLTFNVTPFNVTVFPFKSNITVFDFVTVHYFILPVLFGVVRHFFSSLSGVNLFRLKESLKAFALSSASSVLPSLPS